MSGTEKKPTVKRLRRAHLQQMLSYAEHTEREGWYYGPLNQFEKRHAEIVAWLEESVEKLK